jgi:antitoxin VapB
MLTRIFKNCNPLALGIAKELAVAESVHEVEIEHAGNTLIVRPVVQETIGDLTAILAAFPRDFMADGREFHEQKERDWSAFSGKQSAAG